MKVLIISNTVFSNVTNMGKMLKSYFADFEVNEIAQFYIHSQFPTDADACVEYYRFRDIDALKSIFSKKYKGRVYGAKDIHTQSASVHENAGSAEVLYEVGRQKTPILQIARNLVWKCSRWFNPQFKEWLRIINPDLVFFASGNTVFMYDIAIKIADYLNIPMIMSCCDDYYFFDINGNAPLARYVHKQLLKRAKKAFDKSLFVVTLCKTMADKYQDYFHKECKVLYMGAPERKIKLAENSKAISYIGNVSLGRSNQLASMGRAFRQVRKETDAEYIDVYSTNDDPAVLKPLTVENGIRFCGGITADQVLRVMENSMAVIHTESFDETMQNRVRYSFSTKISDSLRNGPCLLAYGPRGIASIDYLAENDAAYIIDSEEKLEEKMREFLENTELRENIIKNARMTAAKNHDLQIGATYFRKWVKDCLQVKENKQ